MNYEFTLFPSIIDEGHIPCLHCKFIDIHLLMLRKKIVTGILIITFSYFWMITSVLAENSPKPATLFQVNCAGCHPNGNNIIRRGKTLKIKALQRNKIDTIEAITEMITYGKNNMPAYQDRLTTQEIDTLAHYVLEQAQNRWQS